MDQNNRNFETNLVPIFTLFRNSHLCMLLLTFIKAFRLSDNIIIIHHIDIAAGFSVSIYYGRMSSINLCIIQSSGALFPPLCPTSTRLAPCKAPQPLAACLVDRLHRVHGWKAVACDGQGKQGYTTVYNGIQGYTRVNKAIIRQEVQI